jgi:hypothetical protein
LRVCHNDGLGQRDNDFTEESNPTNRTVQVKDFLQKRCIAGVTDPDKQESSKQCLAASASVSSESFNTAKDDASIVKLELHVGVTIAPRTVANDAASMFALATVASAQRDSSSAASSIRSFGTGTVSSIGNYPPSEGGAMYNLPAPAKPTCSSMIEAFTTVLIPQS